jgi:hypothetical protein
MSTRARPAFELAPTFETDGAIVVLFHVREPDWTPSAGVRRRAAFVMWGNSFGDIAGFADVERIVDAAQDVDEPHATTMPSSMAKFEVGRFAEGIRLMSNGSP